MTAHIKTDPETVMYYDALIADIQNSERCSRTAAITKAMLLGLALYLEYKQDNLAQEPIDALQALDFEIDNKIVDAKIRHVKRLYETGQTQKAQELCTRYNLDFDDVIASYTLPISKQDKSSAIREWLQSYFSNRDSIPIRQLKADILEDGIISPSEWTLVKSIASTDGYSVGGKRGIWHKTSLK